MRACPAPARACSSGASRTLSTGGSITRNGELRSTPDPRPCAGGDGSGSGAPAPASDCGTKPVTQHVSLVPQSNDTLLWGAAYNPLAASQGPVRDLPVLRRAPLPGRVAGEHPLQPRRLRARALADVAGPRGQRVLFLPAPGQRERRGRAATRPAVHHAGRHPRLALDRCADRRARGHERPARLSARRRLQGHAVGRLRARGGGGASRPRPQRRRRPGRRGSGIPLR